jgi:hypothetical protein
VPGRAGSAGQRLYVSGLLVQSTAREGLDQGRTAAIADLRCCTACDAGPDSGPGEGRHSSMRRVSATRRRDLHRARRS